MRREVRALSWAVAGILCLGVASGASADIVVKASAANRSMTATTVCPGSLGGGATAITPGAGGTGYAVGDVLSITGGNTSAASCRVQTIGGGGAVTSVVLLGSGTGYATPPTLHATTPITGVGTGCTINVTAVSVPDANGKIVWGPVAEAGGAPWPVLGDPSQAGNPMLWHVVDRDGPFVHRTYAGGQILGPPGANKFYISAVGLGEGSSAGGLHGSIFLPPDTAFAGIGLYGPGPLDSMLIVTANRGVSGQVGLTFSTGSALQVRSLGNSHEQPKATFKLLVYENDAAANADPNRSGVGAKFFGTVVLDGNAGTLQTSGGFGASDWFLVNNGAGKYTARISPGVSKTALVADANAASVVLVGDPAIAQPTPGVSPAVLVLMALALAATGMLALRKRAGPTLA
jgi:hypothetical protein